MAARRGKGEGSISQRPDGRWQVQIDLGRGIDGRRRRKYVYVDTERDAVAELKKLHARTVGGHALASSTPTVGSYLNDWYDTHADTWRPSTRRSYRDAIDRYLVPPFGPVRLEQLSPLVVQRWLNEHKTQHGARRRITLAHSTLRSALAEAQRLQLVPTNAAALVKVPKPKRRTIKPVEQASAFLKVAGTHRLGALFSVALACGLRLGEATGLRWDDVDLESGEIQIRQQLQVVEKRLTLQPLKTETSRRALVLPSVCITALKAHRKRQLEERLKAGDRWGDTGLVFTTYAPRGDARKQGTGLHPRNVLRALSLIVCSANAKSDDGKPPQVTVPRLRFHDLRHSAASLLIAEGVELAEVSKLLGHSEIRITSDLYSHLMKQTATKAARIMDSVLGNA